MLSLLLNWRDWNIPTKLAAVTLVPVIFAIVLGVMQIGDQVERANSYRRVDRLVAVNEQLRPLIGALQQERTASTVLLAAGQANIAALAPELTDEQQGVDTARDGLGHAARRATFHNEITSARYAEVTNRLGELAPLREQLAAGQVEAPTALVRYTAVIASLLSFDRAAAAEVIDPALAGTAVALHDLEAAKEEIRYQQALVGMGLGRGSLSVAELEALRASQARLGDRAADFRVVASPAQQREFAQLVAGPGAEAREKLVGEVFRTPADTALPIAGPDWNAGSDFTAGTIAEVAGGLGGQLQARSTSLQDEASDGAGLASVILLIALVVAAGVMIVVGRHLLRSLNVLRNSALDVAEHELPDAVERIRDGGDGQAPVVVEPVPVRSTDEVGQVARAFDAVHRQALRLATEQAGLRARYSDVFVNLSRRSQGLVQRQLQLLERLERDEEDAEQLATLFQLDHLATRMRRNNENLMVLSGSELGRRNQRPATLADLLRAAVSEIEQYQRVVMLPPPAVLVVGYAVGDLVRLTAELLDNATAFSAPGTQVTIASHSFDDGSLCIAVLDEGIGMSETELAQANAKLADSRTVDVSTSRRMGLFVVGRLASRHGVDVSLHGGRDIPGVRATVTVPAELVTANAAEAQTAALPTIPPSHHGDGNGAVNGSIGGPMPLPPAPPAATVNGVTPSPLPRRTKPSNGSSLVGVGPDPSGPESTQSEISRRLLGDPDGPGETATAGAAADPVDAASADTANAADAADTGERPPLPRRSPGSGQFTNPVDTAAGPVDLAMPEPGYQMPKGDSLFTPADDGWWGTNDSVHSGRSAVEETTPIFDAMVSAWFRSIADKSADGAGEPGDATAAALDEQWQFASDAGFLAAQAVSEAEPDSYTQTGLPRRNPRQNLLPGSAQTNGVAPRPAGQPVVDRDAKGLRTRLNNYQQGVSKARDQRLVEDDAGAGAGPPTLDLSGAGWRFSANNEWQAAAEALSRATPADFTSGGLPRRTPREHPLPEAAEPVDVDGQLRVERAEELRGRLGNFQRGLSRGRRSLAELADRARALGDEITTGVRPEPNDSPMNRESE